MANYPIYRLVKGSTLSFNEMDGNLEWLSRTMSASVVEITGSTFIEGTLNVSNGITGSLYGTASWSERSISASYADTSISASYVSGSAAIVTNLTSSTDANINGLTIGKGNNSLLGNTAIGDNALRSATSGLYNTTVGRSNGYNITTGQYNTALGNSTLFANISSDGNTAVGMQALRFTTGQFNTALGMTAGANITTGQYNTIIGAYGFAAGGITIGSYNTVIGSQVIGLPSGLSNNIILADGQGNIKYCWDATQNNIYGNLAVTGSIIATQNITASNALITGTITAQTLVVQTITSSIIYSSGSNIFGNQLSNTQTLTGSVNITGSLTVNGSATANAFVKIGGTSTQFLKADGTVDSNTYSTSTGTVTSVGGTGTVSGLTLTGTVSTIGNLTLGGTLSLTSANVTDGLGYTPYNATNPDGYVSNAADTYTTTPKITNIVTLSSAEYAAIGAPLTSTLYIII